jgi:glycosyltransferase involved in cell wall biosynthesis
MRVLLIAHNCQSLTEGQPKAVELAKIPDIELMVLTPNRWRHYGRWRSPQVPDQSSVPPDERFQYVTGRVMWPWINKAQSYLHWYPDLKEILRDFRPDIIDLWEEPWSMVSAHTCRLRNRILPGAKIISETEQNINKQLPPPFENLRQFSLESADFCIARNREAMQILRLKGYNGAGEVVPNAVDETLFRPLDKAKCRKDLGVNGFVVGYIGRLVEEKGLLEMVEALPFCDDSVNLLFIGGGPMRDVLQARAGAMGTSTRVRFIDAVPLKELPQMMNALDVLALPSRTTPTWKEQFGRVIIEAHACEVPVIGSSSGAIAEVIGDGGLIFREGDAQELAGAIESLRQNPQRAREMALAGRAQVLEKYTWHRVAQQMHVIYQRALQDGATSQA